MKQKVAELEYRLELAEKKARLSEEAMEYISDLEKLPEDAVLSYKEYGMSVSHQVGKSFRILLGKIKNESVDNNG